MWWMLLIHFNIGINTMGGLYLKAGEGTNYLGPIWHKIEPTLCRITYNRLLWQWANFRVKILELRCYVICFFQEDSEYDPHFLSLWDPESIQPLFSQGLTHKFVSNHHFSPWANKKVSVVPSQTHFPCCGHVAVLVVQHDREQAGRGCWGRSSVLGMCLWNATGHILQSAPMHATTLAPALRKLLGSSFSRTLGNLWAMTCTHLGSIMPNTIWWIHPILCFFILPLLGEAHKSRPTPRTCDSFLI